MITTDAFLFGAGASAEMGMPLAWELTEELTNYLTPSKLRELNAGWRGQGAGYPDRVITEFERVLTHKELNYEQLIKWLQDQYLNPSNRDTEHYRSLSLRLIELVYGILLEHHIRNEIYFRTSLPFYRGLKKLAEQYHPLWIFSLNHDLCIEMIAGEFEIPLKAAFPYDDLKRVPRKDENGNVIGHLTFLHLSRERINAKQFDFIQPGDPGINLVKLHGSLDTFAHGDELNYVKLLPDSNGIKGWIKALQELNTEIYGYKLQGKPLHVLNEIVFTDFQGEIQLLRKSLVAGGHKFDPQVGLYAMPELLEFFKRKLDEFDVLTTIGYGLGDEHVNNIILGWLSSHSSRRLYIVAPSRTRSSLPDGFKALDNQIEIVNEYATDFLDRLSGNTLNEEERRLKGYKRSFRKFQQANREIADEMHDAIQRRSFKDCVAAFMKIWERDPVLAKQMIESLPKEIQDLSQ